MEYGWLNFWLEFWGLAWLAGFIHVLWEKLSPIPTLNCIHCQRNDRWPVRWVFPATAQVSQPQGQPGQVVAWEEQLASWLQVLSSSGPWQWLCRYIDPDCCITYWWEGQGEGCLRTKFNLSTLCRLEWCAALGDTLTSRIHLSPFVKEMPTTYSFGTGDSCKCARLTKELNLGEIFLW